MTGSTQQNQCLQNDGTYGAGEDYITIIAPTLAEVMSAFHAQGLAANYAILHRAGRHSFTLAGGSDQNTTLFNGQPMVAATFARCIPA